jgi:glutaredoxin 3
VRIKIYSRNNCSFCVQAKSLLERHGYEYEEVEVTPQNLAEFKEAAKGAMSVPQILVNDKWIGGFADLEAKEKDGKLNLEGEQSES